MLALAAQPNWVRISESDTVIVSLDAASTKVMGATVLVWALHERKKPNKEYASMKTKLKIDCANDSLAIVGTTTYNAKGESLGSARTEIEEWQDATPGSMGQLVMDTVCPLTKQ